MTAPAILNQLLIVIVLYKKSIAEVASYRTIQDFISISPGLSIFIYDNSPEPHPVTGDHFTYVHDPENSGVSKAYNEAAIIASGLTKKWMLFLDQDTYFDNTFIQRLSDALHNHPDAVAFVPMLADNRGLISPFRWSLGKGKRIISPQEKLLLDKFRFANSGLLISRHAFENVNGYEESIPLDFSDIAFGERLKRVTDHFVVVNISLQHSFSGSSQTSCKEALHRFHYFCQGAFIMGKSSGARPLYFGRTLLRALKFSITFKNTDFLKTFLRRFIHG